MNSNRTNTTDSFIHIVLEPSTLLCCHWASAVTLVSLDREMLDKILRDLSVYMKMHSRGLLKQ